MGKERREGLNPLKAIREKCLDCMCGSPVEVKRCVCDDCPLFPFRFGKNPFRKKRELTDEQKKQLAEKLHKNAPKFTGEKNQNEGGI